MADGGPPSLRAGHRRALGLGGPRLVSDNKSPSPSPSTIPFPAEDNEEKTYDALDRLFTDERRDLLKTIQPWIIKKAWFALAHLMLEPSSRVVDIGCRDGAMAYTMAVLAPTMHFIGLDKNPKTIERASEQYQRPNLEFVQGDVLKNAMAENSADAIICNFLLHEIYSNSGFNHRLIWQTLKECQRYLKPGGLLFMRDYAEPQNAEDLVLMEMPDKPSRGDRLEDLSEPDLLTWYSESATGREDSIRSGFYLEELPPRFPRTRLFRLPQKWAYEFVMRKDARHQWQNELPKEYTFFNEREYRRTLNHMGLRVLYSSPHWDEVHIDKYFEKNFRLLDESGNMLGNPPTSFTVLAQKVATKDSLTLSERRKSRGKETAYHVTTYRNEVDGRLVEVVSRDVNLTEIIPFSIYAGNRLVVYLHEGVPRGLVNAVPRASRNLDGKYWSGHLTEAISLDTEMIREVEEKGREAVVDFMKDMTGLTVSMGHGFVAGPAYYPNPRFIAEQVETRFVSVEPLNGRFVPDFVRDDISGFASSGAVRAFDAQSVLNAISVGVIPSGNLETQLLTLFAMLDIQPIDWSESPLVLSEEPDDVEPPQKVGDILKRTAAKEPRYKEMRGTLGKIRVEQSVFVDEGIDEEGSSTGLAARDVDFVINEAAGMNIAVILPLSKQHSGEVMAGMIVDYLPVPERYKGDGQMVSLPMLALPPDIKNIDMAKRYIAKHFEIKYEQVSKLGEPYFSHVGVTPQRIFPFAINCPHSKMAQPKHGLTAYAPMSTLVKLMWKDMFDRYDIDMLKTCGRMNKRMFSQNEMGIDWGFQMPLVPKYAQATFTTGEAVRMQMPLTGGQDAARKFPAVTTAPPMGDPGMGLGLGGGEMGGTGTGRSAGFSRASGKAGKGGKGGKGGGGGGRGLKPQKKPDHQNDNKPKLTPEPTK